MKKSAVRFDDIAVLGNGANHVSFKPLLRIMSNNTDFGGN